MLRQIKKILLFLTVILSFFIIREFIELYVLIRSLHPVWGYIFLFISAGFLFYFGALPLIKILKMPQGFKPVTNPDETDEAINRRLDRFRSNPYLLKNEFDFSTVENAQKNYDKIIKVLEKETARIRKKYITNLFYATSIAQNGFLDAILILSANINLIKEIFILFNGRVSNKDLFGIGRQIYYSLAIGGSEAIEYAIDETVSKLASDSVRSIPFVDKILGSMADGFVNACLLTRVSMIAENYCKYVYIKSNKDLYPSPSVILTSTRDITSDIYSRVKTVLKDLSKSTSEEILSFASYTINPARFVLNKALLPIAEKTNTSFKYVKSLSLSPFQSIFQKGLSFWKK
ncbi:hypothetical protein IIC38_17135 [candidate division KSB1 bacterium]|nr:hypothetical protein [candidate division KSB1 bacterium]